MAFKFVVWTTALMAVGCRARVIYPHHQLELEAAGHQGLQEASSFMHFHGPVEGPEFEVKVPLVHVHDQDHYNDHDHDHHHHHDQGSTIDYVAHPKYEFSYGVSDHHTGDFHGQKETRDGKSVSGEYSIREPGGNVRTVTYHADKDGFHAMVHNSGGNDHSGFGVTDHDTVDLRYVEEPQEEQALEYPIQEHEEHEHIS